MFETEYTFTVTGAMVANASLANSVAFIVYGALCVSLERVQFHSSSATAYYSVEAVTNHWFVNYYFTV